ncbi:MurR/RpiR family transcriptional regulator [Ruania alkalisoli]|uniref:MurR/RpiR family transcriptional regulator n=1 Tax=Ruania alkalisoli TaxID=2779775 RepID=A0A7M1SU58_9MICO|nr:MurR/RpiR family transcriptional regulator [Ruania alkalisoli]QOR70153.1 MurR/RpiR family transcriptional regulator [Ruania alkalisoli]
MDVLVQLEQRLDALAPAERKLARAVLADPEIVLASTITELAQRCATSQATVVRFCRAAGFEGYKAFRLAVASARSREAQALSYLRVSDAEIAADDDVPSLVAKVAYQQMRAIEETAQQLDAAALDHVAHALGAAERVDIYGGGSSALAAADLHQKLTRLDIASSCFMDPHLALTAAGLANKARVAVAFSHSGRTQETVAFLAAARQHGGITVAVTNAPSSPVARAAQILLPTHAREPERRSGAIASRMAQLAIVDYLVVRMLQADVEHLAEPLQRTREAVQALRLDEEFRQ